MAHGDITHTEIPVSDIARAKTFYGELFGWQFMDAPGMDDYPMWQGPNGAHGGALTPREDGFTQPRGIVEVDSIDETLAKAEAAGATTTHPKQPIDEHSWWAVFRDPDGNSIGLFEGTFGG